MEEIQSLQYPAASEVDYLSRTRQSQSALRFISSLGSEGGSAAG